MKNIHKIEPGKFYLFESLSAANSLFFNSDEEILVLKTLLKRYLSKYVEIHRIFIDANGYQILLKIKTSRTLKNNYKKECESNSKDAKVSFLQEPWRIISEKMRILKSLFVKAINRLRGREGVLVKTSFKKYYFESINEFNTFVKEMKNGKSIQSQKDNEFQRKKEESKVKNWTIFRAKKWAKGLVSQRFTNLIARNLIHPTLSHHNPCHQTHPQLQTSLIHIKSTSMNR